MVKHRGSDENLGMGNYFGGGANGGSGNTPGIDSGYGNLNSGMPNGFDSIGGGHSSGNEVHGNSGKGQGNHQGSGAGHHGGHNPSSNGNGQMPGNGHGSGNHSGGDHGNKTGGDSGLGTGWSHPNHGGPGGHGAGNPTKGAAGSLKNGGLPTPGSPEAKGAQMLGKMANPGDDDNDKEPNPDADIAGLGEDLGFDALQHPKGPGGAKPNKMKPKVGEPGAGDPQKGKSPLMRAMKNPAKEATPQGPTSPFGPGGFGKIGRNLPQKIVHAGSALHAKITTGLGTMAKKVGLGLTKSAAASMASALMIGAPIAAGVGATMMINDNQRVLYNDEVCGTENTGESYAGTENGGKQGGDWSNPGTEQYNNAKAVAKKLKSMGFSGIAIAGIMGNMAQESGFKTQVLNGTGDGGKGLMQWTGNRRAELEDFAKSKGMDSGSLKLQLLMMERDLKKKNFWVSAYKTISPKILNHAKDPADAAMRFYLSQFEAGAGHATDPDGSGSRRQAFAQQAYSTFHLSGIKGDDSKLESLLGGGNAAVANANSADAENLNNINCKAGDSEPGEAHGVAGYALKMVGWFNYSEGQRTDFAKNGDWKNISKLSEVNKDGHVDCTSFSWLCGRLAGYRMNGNSWPWTTQALSDPASAGCKEITNKEDVRPGDFGLNSNHGVVIVGRWKGGNTDAVDCGYDHVRHHPLSECYQGAGGWESVRFFRPVKRR